MEKNKQEYEGEASLSTYTSVYNIFKAEERILKMFATAWPGTRFLDIGVGGGRTTFFYAPLVKKYTGIDYSKTLIEACKKRFINYADAGFEHVDVRVMQFSDASFDFVNFSYNGIDYINDADRNKSIADIYRILNTGGYFFFSSHNANLISLPAGLPLHKKLALQIKNTFSAKKSVIESGEGYHIVSDKGLNGKLETYYSYSEFQKKQLESIGFEVFAIYSTEGLHLPQPIDRLLCMENWLYYLCKKK